MKPRNWLENIIKYKMGVADADLGQVQVNIPPDSKVHGVNMGSTWGRQAPGGPHVGPMNLAIRATFIRYLITFNKDFILIYQTFRVALA